MMSGYELSELSKDKVLTEARAYDIAFGTMSIGTTFDGTSSIGTSSIGTTSIGTTFDSTLFKPKMGFIIVRHVNNKQTD